MGRASARANELFAEDVVMDQYEALFAELEERRLAHLRRLQRSIHASKFGSSAGL